MRVSQSNRNWFNQSREGLNNDQSKTGKSFHVIKIRLSKRDFNLKIQDYVHINHVTKIKNHVVEYCIIFNHKVNIETFWWRMLVMHVGDGYWTPKSFKKVTHQKQVSFMTTTLVLNKPKNFNFCKHVFVNKSVFVGSRSWSGRLGGRWS